MIFQSTDYTDLHGLLMGEWVDGNMGLWFFSLIHPFNGLFIFRIKSPQGIPRQHWLQAGAEGHFKDV